MGKNSRKKLRTVSSTLINSSTTNLPKRVSSLPTNSNSTNLPKVINPISNSKKKKIAKKKKKRSQRKIHQLFERLRSETQLSESMSLDSSSNDTVIELTESNTEHNTPRKSQTSLIIINDDDDLIIKPSRDPLSPKSDLISSPIHFSTPISNKILSSRVNSKTSVNNNIIIENLNDNNTTEEINKSSYLTIDLTSDTLNTTNLNKSQMNTVIDLDSNVRDADDISQNSSMSGDSQVTVLQNKRSKINRNQMEKFVNGIAKLSSTERGKLLEVIAQKIFTVGDNSSHISIKSHRNCSTETAEDVYIKEVILGQALSRNSIGSNIYNPQRDIKNKSGLRMVVIDGSNVAMQHSKGRVFSVKGLKICIDYFVNRGHIVKAFVPQFRCKLGMSTDGKLLDQLERQGLVVYTPSRVIQGRQISSYDDRYIVQCAAEFDGVIVSRDNYRDLLAENPRWRPVIENRLLQFTWVGDLIMFPRDPMGRNGPTLEEFLRHPIVIDHPIVL